MYVIYVYRLVLVRVRALTRWQMHLLDDKLLAAQLECQIRSLGHVHGQRIERSHLVQMQQATVLLEGRMRFTLRAGKGFQLNGIVHQLAYLGQKAGVL